MTGRTGGATTGRVARELAAEQQERLVELVDAVAIRRALSGCPSALEAMTNLEREVVIAIADTYGGDLEITAAVASVLLGLDRQRLAALAVVLAAQVADTDPNAGTTASEHSAT